MCTKNHDSSSYFEFCFVLLPTVVEFGISYASLIHFNSINFSKIIALFLAFILDTVLADGNTSENGCPVLSSKPPRTYFEVTFFWRKNILLYNFINY